MKIFISQKMRNKTQEEIIKERKAIEQAFSRAIPREVVLETNLEFIQSYKPKLKFKDPITSLSQSLAMLAEADVVLVPKIAEQNVRGFIHSNVEMVGNGDYEPSIQTKKKLGEYVELRGCEFELLIAKSYGKKVYTYEEV